MGNVSSFADILRDWESLLAACKDNEALLANAEPQRKALEEVLVEGKALKDRQESFASQRQQSTQELKSLKERGKEAARRLRGAVKANLGTNNERLVQFKVAPVRKRGPRKTTTVAKPPQATPETPGTPGTPVTPHGGPAAGSVSKPSTST